MSHKPIDQVTLSTMTLPDGQEMLLHTFKYRDIEVPAGFKFDGASTPRMFWSIIPPFKLTKRASLIHDWMCRTARTKEDRKKADLYFRQALKEMGLPWWRYTLGYWGVRIGAFLGIGCKLKK